MIPSVVIAGTHSGVGKTTITMGLLAVLRRRGLTVQSFKTGPDYIDPTFHRLITGRTCSNLDSWMMDRQTIARLYTRAMIGADIGVIEGVMGLYDGAAGQGPGGAGSTADLARILGVPVILVVDARSAAQSLAATVHGFSTLDPAFQIIGVIINRIGSARHGQMVKQAVESACKLPVFGCLPRDVLDSMPERHLGLVSAVDDNSQLQKYWATLSDVVETHLNIEQMMEALAVKTEPDFRLSQIEPIPIELRTRVRVAIARDEAFHFYYDDALIDLRERGIEWVPFRPVDGESVPSNVEGVYLGGGYPELYLERLISNEKFMAELRFAHRNGMPIYAECGGYMALCRSIRDIDLREHSLAGLIPATCQMGKKRRALGYVTARIEADTLLGSRGDTLRGHEFHYSDIVFDQESRRNSAFMIGKTDPAGGIGQFHPEGYSHHRLTASYFHFHFSAFPSTMDHFVSQFGGGNPCQD